MTASALISRLHGVQGKGPRWRAICPAHTSKHGTRSLAILEADDGRVLIKCHAGCDVLSIVSAIGLDLSDLFPEKGIERAARLKRPWSARDVAAALKHESMVAWVLLLDIANGKVLSNGDRDRARIAAERAASLIIELDNAS